MCRWLENCVYCAVLYCVPGFEMYAMIYGHSPWGSVAMIRFAILSVRLPSLVLCFVLCFPFSLSGCAILTRGGATTQKRNMGIYLAHICLPAALACTHSPTSPMVLPHGTLLIVLVAPAISCQINFNLIKFFRRRGRTKK